MDLDDGGVDHGVFHVGVIGDGVEQPLPDIRLHPIAEAREYAVPVTERGRQIPPRAAGSGDPQHGLDKLSVILAAAAGITRLAKTKRLHLRPLGVSQNESVHPKLESQPSPHENPESQQTLGRSQAPARHQARIPFWACRRFSASSNTTDCGPSITSSVTSSPRWAGRQCMNSASGFASDISLALT